MSFKIRNVTFEISYVFACAITLFIAFDRTGIFLPLFLAVIAHETAHIIVIRLYKCKISRVTLKIGTLGVEYIDTLKTWNKIIALLAGPIANLVLAIFLYCFKYREYSALNLIIFVYNLFPVKGLDGGEILRLILTIFIDDEIVNTIFRIIGIFLILSLIFIFIFLLKMKIVNYSVLLFCLYLMLTLF